MRILLVQPSCAKEIDKEYLSLQFPLNLGYIASSLRQAGHEVCLLDFNVMERDLFLENISEFKPQAIGLTSMTSTLENAMELIREAKKINAKIITILGGVHASALPRETMEEITELDYLVFGEGEVTSVELATCLEKGGSLSEIKGIVYRKDGQIIKNEPRELIEDISTIPFPARDLVPVELYAKQHVTRGFSRREMRIVEFFTSRGCPNQCIFCAGHINYGMRLRFRSYENIVQELNECITKYGITHVSIEDDTFTINKVLVRSLCVFFKNHNLTWNCYARVNTVNFELLKMMADNGCKKIAFGVESGSPEILIKNKKGILVEQAVEAIKNAKKAGIRYVECDFLIGSHIDETLEDVEKTRKFIFKLMPDFLALSVMCPYPGTEIYQMMLSGGLLDKRPDWSRFVVYGNVKRYERITYLNSEQMIKLQHGILKEYYSSPKYIMSQVVQIRSWKEIKYFSKLGIIFFKSFILNIGN